MVIKEFLPNPDGKDTLGEYILLLNDSDELINLNGWKIKDKSGKIFNLSGYNLGPAEKLKLPYSRTKITLNNDGEELELIGPKGEIIHKLGFSGQAKSGVVVEMRKEITQEIREEFLENKLEEFTANVVYTGINNFWLPIILTGLALTSISIWIVKKFQD